MYLVIFPNTQMLRGNKITSQLPFIEALSHFQLIIIIIIFQFICRYMSSALEGESLRSLITNLSAFPHAYVQYLNVYLVFIFFVW
jgi:hypothetical protein